jgi:hypothetical protein
MARHILQGERPLFFYGQAYLGSLDAWLVAGAFAVLGQSAAAIRLVQSAAIAGHAHHDLRAGASDLSEPVGGRRGGCFLWLFRWSWSHSIPPSAWAATVKSC